MAFDLYHYAYAAGGLYCLTVWAIIYRLAPGSRRVMLWGGLAAAWMGPLFEYWHHQDYWRPDYIFPLQAGSWTFGLEDILVSFGFGGVCAGIFDLMVRRWGERAVTTITSAHALRFLLVLLAAFGLTSLLIIWFRLNSLYATVIPSAGFALWFLSRRPRWIPAALITCLAIGSLMLISYGGFYFQFFPEALARWWLASALSGLMVLGVPVEELLWAATSGLFYGPALRYCQESRR